MKVLLLTLFVSGLAQADLRTGDPVPVPGHQTGDLYQTVEGSGLPGLVNRTGRATGELANINGAIQTITGGGAHITPAVSAANNAQNQLGSGVMRLLQIEGAARSIPNHVGRVFGTQ
jgi:hypothetical protein